MLHLQLGPLCLLIRTILPLARSLPSKLHDCWSGPPRSTCLETSLHHCQSRNLPYFFLGETNTAVWVGSRVKRIAGIEPVLLFVFFFECLERQLFREGVSLICWISVRAMVRGRVEIVEVVEWYSVRSQESFVTWDGWSSHAARKRMKKLITKTSLMSVLMWVRHVLGLLIRITVAVVVCVIFLSFYCGVQV